MVSTPEKKKRVRSELVSAGMTTYGLNKSESIALPDHIGDDEHVLGVIYGQFESTSAMMVATNRRLLFLDIRALHNIVEDTSYDSFGDIKVDEGTVFSRVTLRTKPRDYEFHLVNRQCARRFLNAVEKQTMQQGLFGARSSGSTRRTKPKTIKKPVIRPVATTPDEVEFLHRHHLATLSTRGENGYPYGSTVFYFYDKNTPDDIHFITKSSTSSAANLRKHNKVAFTVTDEKAMATMHVLAVAELEKRPDMKNHLLGLLFKHGGTLSKADLPPVLQLDAGSFLIYTAHIQQVTLKSYL